MITDEYALGSVRQRKLNQMIEAQTMITRTGWLELDSTAKQESTVIIPTLQPLIKNPATDDPDDLLDVDPLVSGPLKYGISPSDWKTQVKAAKQRLQDAKLANCLVVEKKHEGIAKNSETDPLKEGVVKIVDISYLFDSYKPSQQSDLDFNGQHCNRGNP
jgi:hypothetical protein